jgi:hypothetical protein
MPTANRIQLPVPAEISQQVSPTMVIGYRPSRRCRRVARPPAARSSTMYQVTQLNGKNSPLSDAKRQRWPLRRAPEVVSEPTASKAAARPSVQMPAALTPQHYRASAGGLPGRPTQIRPPQ